jgi:hypothetical protein
MIFPAPGTNSRTPFATHAGAFSSSATVAIPPARSNVASPLTALTIAVASIFFPSWCRHHDNHVGGCFGPVVALGPGLLSGGTCSGSRGDLRHLSHFGS